MQAVILAAGLGTRLRPITLTTPKPLLKIDDKTIIEHTLSSLPSGIDEIFIVVNYLRDQIRTHLGEQWNRIPIHYIVQDPLNGTGGAMMLLRNRLQDRFLVVNGDDLYAKEDLEMMMNYSTSILLCPTENQLQNGADLNNEGLFIGLKVSDTQISYRVCGAYLLDQSYFSYPPVTIDGSEHEEFGLPQTLALLSKKHPIHVVMTTNWFPIGTPEELSFVKTKLF